MGYVLGKQINENWSKISITVRKLKKKPIQMHTI